MCSCSHTPLIHILDDDSVLNLYRPFLLGEGQGDFARLMGGSYAHTFVENGETSYSAQHPT